MEIIQLDADGFLFISPDIDDWSIVSAYDICAIIDMDGDLDVGVPEVPNQFLYIYFPIDDIMSLPDLEKLHSVAKMGATLVRSHQKVLSHCGMGHNRCALVAGLILTYLGMSGKEAVELIRVRRQGALYNKAFAEYLEAMPAARPESVLQLAEIPATTLLSAIAGADTSEPGEA